MTVPELERDDERGFSLIELIMVMAIMGIFLGIAGTALANISTTAKRNQDKTIALAELRIAVDRIARDLRAADPIKITDLAGVILPDSSSYAREVAFDVFCNTPGSGTCSTRSLRPIRYRLCANVDPPVVAGCVSNTLQRISGTAIGKLVGPSGPPELPPASQRFAIVNTDTQPVFRYFGETGAEIPSAQPAATFRDCTKTVEVDLRMRSEGRGGSIVRYTLRVALRNFNEVSYCPV